uniref:Transcription factor HNF-4 homolog (inferred by orthology to a D. melanogaster protein) n=1 Tax=Strongyloides venezuelensis TaxID=75913 RepID=A0A0K0FLC1_STRVS
MIQNDLNLKLMKPMENSLDEIRGNFVSCDDKDSQFCVVCEDKADGIHYGILSCRSCCAFFRRSCVHKQKYACRYGGKCKVTMGDRCVCRSCRYDKCLEKGMQTSMVQPKRDPTGSQKNRKAPRKTRRTFVDVGGNPSSVESSTSENALLNSEFGVKFSNDSSHQISYASSVISPISEELKTFFKENEHCEVKHFTMSLNLNSTLGVFEKSISNGDQQYMLTRFPDHRNYTYDHFIELVRFYQEHIRMMELELTPLDQIMNKGNNSTPLREFRPEDIDPLSKAELNGLVWFIEKLDPYKYLDNPDQQSLLQRYSVRKLTLDHIYVASKYTEEIEKDNWVMLNRAYVPPTKTGFERVTDIGTSKAACDSRKRKFQILRPTIDKILHSVVKPFNRMRINDVEITVLHLLLMWSIRNSRFINPSLKPVLRIQREWAMRSLASYYESIGHPEPYLRLGQILLLLPEIETACDMHCQDFGVAKLFDYADMSDYWYEKLCYSSINVA